MYLYNFILQRATGITHAVHGCFAGTKQQEILLSKGKSLELVRPDPNTGKVHTLLQTEVFGVIRSLMSFRLTGGTKGGLSATLRVKKCGMSCFTRERFQHFRVTGENSLTVPRVSSPRKGEVRMSLSKRGQSCFELKLASTDYRKLAGKNV